MTTAILKVNFQHVHSLLQVLNRSASGSTVVKWKNTKTFTVAFACCVRTTERVTIEFLCSYNIFNLHNVSITAFWGAILEQGTRIRRLSRSVGNTSVFIMNGIVSCHSAPNSKPVNSPTSKLAHAQKMTRPHNISNLAHIKKRVGEFTGIQQNTVLELIFSYF